MEDTQLVGVTHLNRHVRSVKLCREMHLQPRGVVGQQGVGGGMGLVKSVACEALHQIKNFIGLVLRDSLLRCALTEQAALLDHLFKLLFTHGAAQHISAT